MDTKRLEYIRGLPAKEVVEQQAEAVTDLLQCCLNLTSLLAQHRLLSKI